MNVTQNETYEIHIKDIGIHGEGIGKIEDFTVFVQGALPGETVRATIQTVKKSYAVGKLKEILFPSPDRVKPACPVYDICGGCQISALTYEAQLRVNENFVRQVVHRIGGFPEEITLPILKAKRPFYYRNKMAVPAAQVTGGPVVGYYRQGTHRVVDIDKCFIQEEGNNRLLRLVKRIMKEQGITGYNDKNKKGTIRHIMGRVGDKGKMMAVIVTATKDLPKKEIFIKTIREEMPEVISIYHNVQEKGNNVILGDKMTLLWGTPTIEATLCGLTFEISPYSFFQVNKEQAEVLYNKALEFADLTGNETVIDAYCGTGTISLCLAKKAKKVIGIEIVAPAIEDAKKNAKRNNVENVEFHAADAGKLMPKLYKEGLRPDVIVMDPVRAGCSIEVLEAAVAMAPKKIVYVSCGPSTFARDAKILAEKGYKLTKVQPVDMFPQTVHVELVSELVREE